ncbi:MAG: helix-turn-helix domain-containing protein [Clostridia bacterium]|nr:helix-turn-helix domain-containing protein [Clostridia bacterium]
MFDDTLQRIIALMESQNIQDQDMIKYLGLPRGTFSNWKREKGKSYYEHIAKIADRLNVSVDYLVRGYEIDASILSHDEIELFENIRKLPSEKKAAIIQMSKLLLTD